MFSLPWAWVQFLARELKSHRPHGTAKKKKDADQFVASTAVHT